MPGKRKRVILVVFRLERLTASFLQYFWSAGIFLCEMGCFLGMGFGLAATGLPKNPKKSQKVEA
ncbi:MAG TPA: hypothetical protein VLV84_03910 [Candidatus Acidoferrales bacterium]|nr:hypothetical protein [Candidatus Acidoferrales bacterium]